MKTFGDVMQAVREVGRCEGSELRRSGSVLKRVLGNGASPDEVWRAVHGLRKLVDEGGTTLEPGDAFGLRYLFHAPPKSGRSVYARALERYEQGHHRISDGQARGLLDTWGVDL